MNAWFKMKTGRRLVPLALITMGCLAITAVFFMLNRPFSADASSGYLTSAESQYPDIVGSKLDSCNLCHTVNIPSLNPYGSDFMMNGHSFSAIESLDSDKDGFTNIQEIAALTFPGDANDHPASLPTATPTSTNTSVPTATKTKLPSSTATNTDTAMPTASSTYTTVPSSTATNTPKATVTSNPTATNTPTATVVNTPTAEITPTVVATQERTATMSVTATSEPSETATATEPATPFPSPTSQKDKDKHTRPSPTNSPHPSGEIRLNPSADAYVEQNSPQQNFGTSDALRADDSPLRFSYLRFTVPGDLNGTVVKATLQLYVTFARGAGFSVFPVNNDNWDENKIDFENAPSYADNNDGPSSSVNNPHSGQWVTIDVTLLIQDLPTIDLALVADQGAWNSFASRESQHNHAPRLMLVTAASSVDNSHAGSNDDGDYTGDSNGNHYGSDYSRRNHLHVD